MTDDLDSILRARLERLARAVPMSVPAPGEPERVVASGPPRYRGRVRLGTLTAAVVLVALLGAAAYFAGGSAPREVSASTSDGAFRLSIRSPKDRYAPQEPIEVSATLEYLGERAGIEVGGALPLVGFGVEQLDGVHEAPPGYRLACRSYPFVRGEPQSFVFAKAGDPSAGAPDAAFMQAYLNVTDGEPDPILRLPAGTWRIFAEADFGEETCGGTKHELEVGITVVVSGSEPSIDASPSPSPTASPPASAVHPKPVEASATDGTFRLTIRSPQDGYPAFEAIEVAATLEYLGPSASIGATGSGSGLVGFGIEQVGGAHRILPSWTDDCKPYSLDRGQPVAVEFSKSGGFSEDDPDAGFFKDYFADPVLRLPPGTWRLFAIIDLTLGGCGGERHQLEAEIVIVVDEQAAPGTDAPAPTRPPPGVVLQYPDGCMAYGLSERRCAYIVDWARSEAGLSTAELETIELLGDPDCEGPDLGRCNTRLGSTFVVRVRFTTALGAANEQSVFCGLGGRYSLLCSETPEIRVSSPTINGYGDVPCSGEGPVGCATPLPTVDPTALAEAVPLSIDKLDIPIDHTGDYRIELGTAVLPNGTLSEASLRLAGTERWLLLSEGGLALTITSTDPTRPPFDNAWLHGWYPGTERVTVWLEFTVLQVDPIAVIEIADIVVR